MQNISVNKITFMLHRNIQLLMFLLFIFAILLIAQAKHPVAIYFKEQFVTLKSDPKINSWGTSSM